MKKNYFLYFLAILSLIGLETTKAQVSKTNNTVFNVNGNTNTHIINFTAGDFGGCTSLTDVDISINWQGDPFPVAEQIAVSVQSPTGTIVHLIFDTSGILTGNSLQQPTYSSSFVSWPSIVTTFDDGGIPILPSATAPEAGSFIPNQPLSGFNGENPVGNWTITYSDAIDHNFGPGFEDGFTVNMSTVSVTCGAPITSPSVTLTPTNINCNGTSTGSIVANVTGGSPNYDYVWTNGSSTLNTASLSNTISSLTAGYYKVVVTDNTGLKDSADVTLTQPTLMVASVAIDSNVSCNAFSDGGATASATGGTPPYTYAWDNTATTASITGITAGTYSVIVTDANGCTASSSTTITQPALLVVSSVVDSNASCYGFSNGGATTSAFGGTAPYTYAWSNSATTASITGVTAGTYTVTITDANGCTNSSSATITEPELSASTDTVVATSSYEWVNGTTYTETTYGPTYTYTNINGCDSVVTLDLTIINYCASRSTRNRFEWIKQVELEDDIDNLSNKDAGGFGDYSDQLLTVDTNDVVSVTLTPGYRRRVYQEYWRIWADWNYDGDFNDPGEKVFEQSGKNVRTGTFTVPKDVDPHELGLRISMRWKRYAPSCGNFRNGEVEDYKILVNGAQGYINPTPTRLSQEEETSIAGDLYEFLDLYPNPVVQGESVTGYIRVENTGEKRLQIVNTLGQVIKSETIICDDEESRFDFSTEGLAKGIYFINIESGLETIKIIVR